MTFPDTLREEALKVGEGCEQRCLSLARALLCTNVPRGLALPQRAQEVSLIGTEQRPTQQRGKPPACRLRVTSMPPRAKIWIPTQELWSDWLASARRLDSWACGCTDNTFQVGGLAGLAPTTRSSSNRTHPFLLGTCPPLLSDHKVQVGLTPFSQGLGAQSQSWPLALAW